MKKSHFFGDWWFLCDLLCHFWWIFGWDWGTPAILRQNPNIYGQFQGKLGFGQFWKKVGIGSDPPPLLGPKSQLLPKICFGGFPYSLLDISRRCSIFIFDGEVGAWPGLSGDFRRKWRMCKLSVNTAITFYMHFKWRTCWWWNIRRRTSCNFQHM